MGDNRKDDVRIYLIFVFFFICSTSGGILLCLYIFLPSTHAGNESRFAILGLVLVAVPWIAWFLIYIYRCFKPTATIDGDGQFHDRINDDNNNNKPLSGTPKSSATPSEVVARRPSASSYESVAAHSQDNGGERHVHFGAIMVMNQNGSSHGSNNSHGQIHPYRKEFSDEIGMSKSERPSTSITRS